MKDYKAQVGKLRASIPVHDDRIYGYQINEGIMTPLKTNYTEEQQREPIVPLTREEAREVLKHSDKFLLFISDADASRKAILKEG